MKKIICILSIVWFATSAYGQKNKTDETSLKQKAAAYTYANKLDSALVFGRQLVSRYPSTENYLLLGSIYEMKNDRKNSDILYEKAVGTAGADLYKVYNDLSYVAFRRNTLSKAIDYAHLSLQIQPIQPDLHYFIGGIYEAQVNTDSAKSHFIRAYEQDSTQAEYAKKLYGLYYVDGFVEQSLSYVKRLTILDTLNMQARFALANGYMELDNYEAALSILNLHMGDSSVTDSQYYALSKCYLQLGDTLNSIMATEKAIQLSPTANDAYYDQLIHIYASQGKYGTMLETTQKALTAGIIKYKSWVDLYSISIDTMNIVYKNMNQGNLASSLFQLGKLYLSIQDYSNALKVLTDYESLNVVTNPDSLYCMKAICLVNTNKNTEAKHYIEKAISLAPLNTDYQELLLAVLYKLQEYQSIIDVSKRLDASQKKNGSASDGINHYLLFKSYSALGNTNEAALHHKYFFN